MARPRRVEMVAQQIRRELSDMLLTDTVLQHAVLPEAALGADRNLSSLTTVTDVEVCSDLQGLPLAPDGHSPLSKALSVALLLADLQMDAEVISAGILGQVLEAGGTSILEVRDRIGTGTAHLLHESMQMKNIPWKIEVLDDDGVADLRKFCLTMIKSCDFGVSSQA